MKGFMICYDGSKKIVEKISLLKLPIKEREIVKRSKEIYGENEPCIIYKTAIINRVGFELISSYRDGELSSKLYSLEELERVIGDIFDLSDEVKYIKFE